MSSLEEPQDISAGTPNVPRDEGRDPRWDFPINVMDTSLPRMSGKAWMAINAKNVPPRVFAVGNVPMRIVGGHNDVPVSVQEISIDILSGLSARSAYWHKEKKDGTVEMFPLQPVIRDMLANSHPPLPPLRRVVSSPTFGEDGSISVEPGYNPMTRNYYAAVHLRVKQPRVRPSRDEVKAAVDFILDDFFADFPFSTESDRAHALSLLINHFVRDMIGGSTPLYLVEAPTQGTGKGLFSEMATLPALGKMPTLMSPITDDEEARKTLTATLFGLPEAVLIDNVPEKLDSPHLSSALTSPIWTGRVLQRSADRTVPIRCTWIATGNNPTLSPEMERRTVRIRLDSKLERPEERTGFRHPRLKSWALEHRSEIVSAALTIIQAWVAEGMPEGSQVLGSFDEWAAVHGGILDVAGVPGFLSNRDLDRSARVTESSSWEDFVARWWAKFTDHAVGTDKLYFIAKETPEFSLGRFSDPRAQKTHLGIQLKGKRNVIVSGYEIEFVGKVSNANHYRLRQVEEML